MSQVHVIRHKLHVEGLSVRRVAQDMGVSRNTVRKYRDQTEPVRVETRPRDRPVFTDIQPRIDALLDAWTPRTTAKQRITGTLVHRQLRAEGHDVGITVVRDYLRLRRHRQQEVMVPLVWTPGDAAQVDFFEVTVEVKGVRQKCWMFVMRLMYSGRDFAWLYPRCDQICFLDGHVRAFAHFGAVPQRCIYDNLKPAVRKIVGCKRELSGRFLACVSHYLFEPSFARPGEGHDKGGVESRGKAVRLRYLSPIPQGESLSALSESLLAGIDRDMHEQRHGCDESITARFVTERAAMLALPASPFDARLTKSVEVYSNAKVRVLSAWYSVPSHWPRTQVTARVGVDTVELAQAERSVSHPRQAAGAQSIRYAHYLPELAKKPQAVRQVIHLLLEEMGEPFGGLWRFLIECHGAHDAARVFAKMLGAVIDHGRERVALAIREALADADDGLLGLTALYAPKPPAAVVVPLALQAYEVEARRASDFDVLLQAGGDP